MGFGGLGYIESKRKGGEGLKGVKGGKGLKGVKGLEGEVIGGRPGRNWVVLRREKRRICRAAVCRFAVKGVWLG